MSRILALVSVVAAVTASGVVHGVWVNRWGQSRAVMEASARLQDVPRTVGDWDGRAEEMDPRQARVASVAGSRIVRFVNRRTGAVLSLLIVCGRPGPVSVHTPDVCYRGSGYEEVGGPARQQAGPKGAAEFWVR